MTKPPGYSCAHGEDCVEPECLKDRPAWLSGSRTTAPISDRDPPAPSDEELLQRLAAGQRDACWNELFRRYQKPAYRVAARLLGNEDDALDAVQIGFLKTFNNLQKFRGRSSFKIWLLSIVHNAALDLRRERKRRGNLRATLVHKQKYRSVRRTEQRTPLDEMVEQELREAIERVLERAPDRQRLVFAMRESGLHFQKIAEKLNVSMKTAWLNWKKVLTSLQEQLL